MKPYREIPGNDLRNNPNGLFADSNTLTGISNFACRSLDFVRHASIVSNGGKRSHQIALGPLQWLASIGCFKSYDSVEIGFNDLFAIEIALSSCNHTIPQEITYISEFIQ